MLGRVRRPSISSLELLELEERAPPKLIKDDPLSIYESTMMKLKEGSRRYQSLPLTDATISKDVSCIAGIDSPETIGFDCSSSDSSLNSDADQPTFMSLSQRKEKNLSVIYLFSKYKSPKNAPTSSDEEAMVIDNVYSCVNNSCSVDNSQFMSC